MENNLAFDRELRGYRLMPVPFFYVFKLPSSMGARSGFEKAAAETWVVSAAVVHFFWKLDLFTMEELNNNKITLSGDAL